MLRALRSRVTTPPLPSPHLQGGAAPVWPAAAIRSEFCRTEAPQGVGRRRRVGRRGQAAGISAVHGQHQRRAASGGSSADGVGDRPRPCAGVRHGRRGQRTDTRRRDVRGWGGGGLVSVMPRSLSGCNRSLATVCAPVRGRWGGGMGGTGSARRPRAPALELAEGTREGFTPPPPPPSAPNPSRDAQTCRAAFNRSTAAAASAARLRSHTITASSATGSCTAS
jgi:hypothetical protein